MRIPPCTGVAVELDTVEGELSEVPAGAAERYGREGQSGRVVRDVHSVQSTRVPGTSKVVLSMVAIVAGVRLSAVVEVRR